MAKKHKWQVLECPDTGERAITLDPKPYAGWIERGTMAQPPGDHDEWCEKDGCYRTNAAKAAAHEAKQPLLAQCAGKSDRDLIIELMARIEVLEGKRP